MCPAHSLQVHKGAQALDIYFVFCVKWFALVLAVVTKFYFSMCHC